jgi:hypothetical protein
MVVAVSNAPVAGLKQVVPLQSVPPANRAETADHAKADPNPPREMTQREADSAMPMPGQANDHSSTAPDPKK